MTDAGSRMVNLMDSEFLSFCKNAWKGLKTSYICDIILKLSVRHELKIRQFYMLKN